MLHDLSLPEAKKNKIIWIFVYLYFSFLVILGNDLTFSKSLFYAILTLSTYVASSEIILLQDNPVIYA